MKLAEEKTRNIRFGRFAREDAYKRGRKPEEFAFLSFTHYCGKNKDGYFKVKRRTSRKKFGESLRKFTNWARVARCRLNEVEMRRQAKVRINGPLNYYAITDNSRRCGKYGFYATRITFKWLNRESQRKGYNWAGFNQVIRWLVWPQSSIRRDLNPCRRAEAY